MSMNVFYTDFMRHLFDASLDYSEHITELSPLIEHPEEKQLNVSYYTLLHTNCTCIATWYTHIIRMERYTNINFCEIN